MNALLGFKLLLAHGDLDAVLDARPDLNGDELRMYRRHVATMPRDLPSEPPADGSPDRAAGADAARERGVLRLADRLDERAAA